MGSLIEYSGLATKIRAMQSNLISSEEFEEIANLTSVADLFLYLQKHPGYKHLFSNMDASEIHRGDIEAFLRFSTYRDFTKIYNFAGRKQRKYLDCVFIQYEIEVLKRYLRNILDSREDATLTVVRNDFELHSKIDTKRIAESATVEEFIRNLEGTAYYTPLNNLQQTTPNLTLFDYEMCLDLFYFTTMWKSKDKFFKGEELEIVTHNYGMRIDMLNIIWVYRSKKYYNLSAAQIYAFLIPIYFKLRSTELLALAEAETIDSYFDILAKTRYGKYFTREALDASMSMEHIESTVAKQIHVKDYQRNPYSIATVTTFLFLKEKEIHNLITATECIRYGYPPDVIMKNIV